MLQKIIEEDITEYYRMHETLKLPDEDENSDNGLEINLKQKLISNNMFDFKKEGGLNIKTVIKSRAGIVFCTSVLKVLLIKTEEQIASVLISHYHIQLDQDLLRRALSVQMFEFFRNTWRFKKNFLSQRRSS